MPSNVRPATVLGPVYASTTLTWLSYAIVAVALPFRFEALGLNVVEYGTVVAVFAIGMLATESVWGAYAYRIANRVWVLGLGAIVGALLFSLGVANSEVTFALAFGLLGGLVIFAVPLMRWLALTSRGPGTGGTGTARYAVFSGAGIVAGSALGPVLYVGVGFFWLAVISAVLWMAGIVVLDLIPWPRLDVAVPRASVLRQVRRVLTPYFGMVAVLVTLLYTCTTLTSNFLQYYSVALFGGTPAESGFVIGAARATALVAGFLLGPVVDRGGPRRSAPFGFLLLGLGAVGTFFSHSYAEMVASTLVFATGAGWLTADLLPLALAPVPRDLQGTAIGVFGSFEDLGQIVGPVLIGGSYAVFGATSIFLVVVAVAAVGGASAVALAVRSRPPAPRGTLPSRAGEG